MGEELEGILPEAAVFIPSHLTRGLVAGTLAIALGVYASWEFAHVSKEEVIALIKGG